MCVFGLVLDEPFRDQIQRRFEVDVSEEPVLPDTEGATVREPEVPEGSVEYKATEPTIAVDPGLKLDSAVLLTWLLRVHNLNMTSLHGVVYLQA